MSAKDVLGDKCKAFEMAEAGRAAMPGLPLLVRLDGRAFHTFTRGLERPFSAPFITCMVETTKHLVGEFHAAVGYTQSDEITLLWSGRAGLPFSGRWQKLTSVLAGSASARFAQLVPQHLPAKAHAVPCFDARAWQVPTPGDALDVFVWREDDATKNSVAMAAQSVCSARELHGQGRADQLDMLHARGINWNEYPAAFKRGSYVKRLAIERVLTDEERARIPEKHRPAIAQAVMRTHVAVLGMPPIRKVGNALAVLFDDAAPEARTATAPIEVTP